MSRRSRQQKPVGADTVKVKCQHLKTEDVRSANGAIVYGYRCLHCLRQWANEKCKACGVGRVALANRERTSWTCRKCKKAAEGGDA